MAKILQTICGLIILGLMAGCAGSMHTSAAKGDIKAIDQLLAGGANINENAMGAGAVTGGTPLFYAAFNCQADAARYLVSKGADVEAAGFFSGGFFSGRPLHAAVKKDCLAVVKILLDGGADINARVNDKFGSPLAVAADAGHVKIIKYLIARGADIDDAAGVLRRQNRYDAVALLEKYTPATTSAEKQMVKTKAPLVRSDVDIIPDWKARPRPNDFAVVIGVENYAGLPKSDYSNADAEMMQRYLVALGFPQKNIELLTDAKATRSAVDKSLEAWLPNHTDKKSTVFVYFSGHGAPEPATGDAYLVPYDGDPNYLPQTGYPLKRLYEQLAKLPAKEIIVVLDSCFSGAGGRSVLAKGTRPLVMMSSLAAPPANTVVITASEGSQISTSSPDRGHGIFTYYFLRALQEGKMDVAGIYEYIRPQVESEARRLNVRQTPSISPSVEKMKTKFNLGN